MNKIRRSARQINSRFDGFVYANILRSTLPNTETSLNIRATNCRNKSFHRLLPRINPRSCISGKDLTSWCFQKSQLLRAHLPCQEAPTCGRFEGNLVLSTPEPVARLLASNYRNMSTGEPQRHADCKTPSRYVKSEVPWTVTKCTIGEVYCLNLRGLIIVFQVMLLRNVGERLSS
jgi:hypothetical protein